MSERDLRDFVPEAQPQPWRAVVVQRIVVAIYLAIPLIELGALLAAAGPTITAVTEPPFWQAPTALYIFELLIGPIFWASHTPPVTLFLPMIAASSACLILYAIRARGLRYALAAYGGLIATCHAIVVLAYWFDAHILARYGLLSPELAQSKMGFPFLDSVFCLYFLCLTWIVLRPSAEEDLA